MIAAVLVARTAQVADMVVDIVESFARFVSVALDLWGIVAVVELVVPTVSMMVAKAVD